MKVLWYAARETGWPGWHTETQAESETSISTGRRAWGETALQAGIVPAALSQTSTADGRAKLQMTTNTGARASGSYPYALEGTLPRYLPSCNAGKGP